MTATPDATEPDATEPDATDSDSTKRRAGLTGVSETALMTLHSRASEARRPDATIYDPMAIRLVDSIDDDFTRFGTTPRQDMAVRAKTFDRQTSQYLREHPGATVVALAEGLQTSFWRLDAALPQPRFRWLTVDLPPIIDLRRALLPASPRIQTLAQSALDYSWLDAVDPSEGVFITAEGLLMYLQPEESLTLIGECAKRFPGGRMMFDLPPVWFARIAQRGWLRPSRRYTVPTMPFALTPAQAVSQLGAIPGVTAVHDVPLEPGRGRLFNGAIELMYRTRLLDSVRGITALLEFG
jgi:O-methyltransferase involved in polyketide biosynthesis